MDHKRWLTTTTSPYLCSTAHLVEEVVELLTGDAVAVLVLLVARPLRLGLEVECF